MEVVVVGMESRYVTTVIEELKRRGIKVILVPGNVLTIYTFHNGFQELDGDAAERYISSLLEPLYLIEYY